MKTKLRNFLEEGGLGLAVFIVTVLLLVVIQVLTHATNPPIKMAWTMEDHFALRTSTLTAFPVAASDFEVPVRCSYLGDMDLYIWQFVAVVPGGYQTGDWVVCGQSASGIAAAQIFSVSQGAIGSLATVQVPAPVIEGTTAYYTFPQTPEGVVSQWQVLVDGAVLPPDENGDPVTEADVTGAASTQIRAVLVGTPANHYITGPVAVVEIGP